MIPALVYVAGAHVRTSISILQIPPQSRALSNSAVDRRVL